MSRQEASAPQGRLKGYKRGILRDSEDLQLYLDLHSYPIRGLEQAEHLYEKRLKRIIEGTYLL
jgi:hypothetical protein